ncbi:mago nashi protein [Sugiyamaella lignohabitans]|uniref:Mago nashi protein n=1 Tax=Sugiyamaella lignohabitans TaxID=796027 RepID=A0A167CGA1_9ASCO|nr:mago nashi protein [Sugiyamaella lignohabitans]ANB11649.1 mago nashi protein [Sugiyamaella lignohabitans]
MQDDGQSAALRYANNSKYRNDTLIKKEARVSPATIAELKRIIAESEIFKEDDARWPPRNRDGKQELEVRAGKYHISFEVGIIAPV